LAVVAAHPADEWVRRASTAHREDAMLKPINPPDIAPPFSRYSQGIEAPAGLRWLYVSGQVGVRPDGMIEQGFAAQAERAWDNVLAVLAAAGMGPADIVKVNVYLTQRSDMGESRRIRGVKLGDAAPASTLAVVASLADPAWLFEVDVVAARA
jgi:enamine deaminase RidA (YjgF/YER057c/UK114 family)